MPHTPMPNRQPTKYLSDQPTINNLVCFNRQVRFELEDDRLIAVQAGAAAEAAERIATRYRIPSLLSPELRSHAGPALVGAPAQA